MAHSEQMGSSSNSKPSIQPQTQTTANQTVAMIKIRTDSSSDAHAATDRILSAFNASSSQKISEALHTSNLQGITLELAEKPGDTIENPCLLCAYMTKSESEYQFGYFSDMTLLQI